jgi:hypothetical protein
MKTSSSVASEEAAYDGERAAVMTLASVAVRRKARRELEREGFEGE